MQQTLQLILSLSLLVLIHELGHFTFAKLFKARVDKFYLFFNPWFSLFKFKKGETTYGIGWLPFGGYCKIAGMVDESMDKDQLQKPAQPWEYRSKTLGQRFLIISGGVIFNFILAFIIYSGILYTWGQKYLPIENAEYGIYCDSLALSAGFMHGDKILLVEDEVPERLSDVVSAIVIDGARNIRVKRGGKEIDVVLPESLKQAVIANQNAFFITEFIPFIVDSLIPNMPAAKSGLRKNDHILGIDSIPTPAFFDFVTRAQTLQNESVVLTVMRNGFEEFVPIQFSAEGTIGVYPKDVDQLYEFKHIEYSLLESIPAGIVMGVSNLSFYVKQLKLVFTKEGSQQMGSFGTMRSMFSSEWNWQWFWVMTALFSIILGFMNILPIPALDGGHLMFLLYELFTGKKPSDAFLERAQMIGMTIVFGLFLYAIMLDIGRLF